MRFWPFGRKKQADATDATDAHTPQRSQTPIAAPSLLSERAEASSAPELVTRLVRVDLATQNGRLEAGQILHASRGTPHEARVVDVLLERLALLEISEPAGGSETELLRVQTALVLVDRGDRARAEALVASAASARGLFMAAELAEARGEIALALTRLERVLARDVDYAGARERHKRLRATLGLVASEPKRAGATALVPQADAPYKLLREIARGGAGAVYEAHDPVLARSVALKMLHDPTGQGDVLLHEMRITAELAGDDVIRVFDADANEGWLAFEWAPRGSLREALRAGAPLVHNVASWLPRVARALARVHANGVVHCDVKPANLLFLDDDTPVLSDFGIARRAGESLVGGSMGYLSPDRLRETTARPWHDVYGFGRLCEEVAACPACTEIDRGKLLSIVRLCLGEESAAPQTGTALAELVTQQFAT